MRRRSRRQLKRNRDALACDAWGIRIAPGRSGWGMVTDAIRLLLFPALMAFAASSDLFTMTISNRVSIVLIAGFFAMAMMTGMSGNEIAFHLGAAALVLAVTFTCFAAGWIR